MKELVSKTIELTKKFDTIPIREEEQESAIDRTARGSTSGSASPLPASGGPSRCRRVGEFLIAVTSAEEDQVGQ